MPTKNTSIKPWHLNSSEIVGDFKIFKVRSDNRTSPRTGKKRNFYVIESVDWCNVIAITKDDELVMVEQYRQGTSLIELELPGGMIDPGEIPVETAPRELREETGYSGESPEFVGLVYANPAIMNNKVHTFVIRNSKLKHKTEFDEGEDLAIRLVPIKNIPKLISNGTISHSLMIAALSLFSNSNNKTD
ncbi:MAG: NUDIX hydrolase [Limisphaerales bacterium]|nr:MAG: NUDIX hydrolase [Limisphaerales bacterium]